MNKRSVSRTKQIVIYPYKKFSAGARLLAKYLGAVLRYKPTGHNIINWGNHIDPGLPIINSPFAVDVASDKLATFQHLEGVCTVPWTMDRKVVHEWLKAGKKVVARTLLRGSEGRGITIIEPSSDTKGVLQSIPSARLYTQYVPKKKEFRTHVAFGSVIDVQEKRKKSGEESNSVRSHDNGYVFCREGIVEPKDLRPLSLKAIQQLGLDFGAVDVIWNEKLNKCFVLEVNTAPGLTDTTAKIYAEAFRRKCSS